MVISWNCLPIFKFFSSHTDVFTWAWVPAHRIILSWVIPLGSWQNWRELFSMRPTTSRCKSWKSQSKRIECFATVAKYPCFSMFSWGQEETSAGNVEAYANSTLAGESGTNEGHRAQCTRYILLHFCLNQCVFCEPFMVNWQAQIISKQG